MSDDPTTPRPDEDDSARPTTSEPTGVVDLSDTQVIPTSPRPRPEAPTNADLPGAGPQDRGWFEDFSAEHPIDGPGIPPRADASWGSDRADALAEQAHRARYAPPTGVPVNDPSLGDPTAHVASPQSDPVDAGAGVGVGAVADQPAADAATDAATAAPVAGAAGATPATGALGATTAVATARPRGRRRLAIGVAALCLASGLLGGLTSQLLDNRVTPTGSTLPEPGPGVTERPAGSVASIAGQVLPSVVTIKVDAGNDGSGTGSGFVIDTKGHVLTNNHVVAAGADGGTIEVVLSNGDTEDATIVGRDGSYDLAVLRLNRTDLTPLQLGPSDKVVVGDQVIAVGAPLGLDQTVTTGIVSALNRPVSPGAADENTYINAIQTDAAINPGNSGGPLLDMNGRVIGVNSAIARVPGATPGGGGGNIGLGFAIPSDQARRTADQLIATGKATHPIIGVLLDRTYSGDGAQVQDKPDAVTPDGPAAKAGVEPGDVIVSFEGKPVRTPDQLIVSIRARAVGETVTLRIERDGKPMDLRMTLEADPNG